MEAKIDLSPRALKEHREQAERAKFRYPDTRKESDLMTFMGSTSAEFVIAIIDEIEHLRATVDGYNESNGEAQEIIAEQEKEIERLQSENASLSRYMEISEDAQGLTAAYMAGQMDKIDTIGKLKRENTRLKKEADWLAQELRCRCHNHGCNQCGWETCPVQGRDTGKAWQELDWREAARKAVEEQ